MDVSKMALGRDINGYVTYALSPANSDAGLVKSVTLDQNVNASFTVPSSFSVWQVAFSFEPGARVWVAYDDDAEIPAGNTFADTTSELNPTLRQLAGGTVVDCITEDTTADVGVVMYALSR